MTCSRSKTRGTHFAAQRREKVYSKESKRLHSSDTYLQHHQGNNIRLTAHTPC